MKWYKEKLPELASRDPVLSCCGDDCAVCPRRLATTDDELHETAVFWHEVGWRDRVVTNDEIRCDGCGTRQRCAFMILPCMKEHAVAVCRDCPQYPCGKITDMLRSSEIKAEECHSHCPDEDEWLMLKRAFYEKEKNLNIDCPFPASSD